jgi:uncharacterized protein DUF4242
MAARSRAVSWPGGAPNSRRFSRIHLIARLGQRREHEDPVAGQQPLAALGRVCAAGGQPRSLSKKLAAAGTGATVKRGVKRRPGSVAYPRTDREERTMPLFMDVHNIEGGVSAADVAGAHQADLATQGAYGVNYQRYWVDEEAGKIFCLVEAPDAETANTVHREAHGLVADEIYPISGQG